MKKQNIIRSVLVVELLLLVPLVGMLFSNEWGWDLFDFIVAGVLLAGAGVGYQMIVTGMKNNRRQAIAGIVLALAMVIIWVELAVGIFD